MKLKFIPKTRRSKLELISPIKKYSHHGLGEIMIYEIKPQWMLDFEDGRAVIDVEIRAASGDQKGKVTVDGNVVAVLSEKESLTSLGRDELLDGRTSKMDLLVRYAR